MSEIKAPEVGDVWYRVVFNPTYNKVELEYYWVTKVTPKGVRLSFGENRKLSEQELKKHLMNSFSYEGHQVRLDSFKKFAYPTEEAAYIGFSHKRLNEISILKRRLRKAMQGLNATITEMESKGLNPICDKIYSPVSVI